MSVLDTCASINDLRTSSTIPRGSPDKIIKMLYEFFASIDNLWTSSTIPRASPDQITKMLYEFLGYMRFHQQPADKFNYSTGFP